MQFTVIGYFEDDNTSFCDWAEADGAIEAMAQASRAHRGDHESLMIIGAIEGKHHLIGPSDESDSLAAARDLMEL